MLRGNMILLPCMIVAIVGIAAGAYYQVRLPYLTLPYLTLLPGNALPQTPTLTL